MTAYYNEFDPKAAAGLRALIEDGFIAPGDVDTRSIAEVQPDDLRIHAVPFLRRYRPLVGCPPWRDVV